MPEIDLDNASQSSEPKNKSDRAVFSSVESSFVIWQHYKVQISYLEEAYRYLMATKDSGSDLWHAVVTLLYSTIESSKALSLLAQNGHIRDCFVTARTVTETTINICFICAKGDEAAKKARRHAFQKTFRDLDRQVTVNSQNIKLRWQGKEDIVPSQDLQEALDEFTTKRGREIRSWTHESIVERLEVVDEVFGSKVTTNLQFAVLGIYRHASEIAHGTLFGALFPVGLTVPTDPPRSEEEMSSFQVGNISMILVLAATTMLSTLIVLSKMLPSKKLESLADAAKNNIKEINKEPWVKAKTRKK